jgi:hypothetical protein
MASLLYLVALLSNQAVFPKLSITQASIFLFPFLSRLEAKDDCLWLYVGNPVICKATRCRVEVICE